MPKSPKNIPPLLKEFKCIFSFDSSFSNSLNSMCDHLDLEPLKLEDEDTIRFEGEQGSKKSAQRDDEAPKEIDQYENEDEYQFYSNLIDLKDHVPDVLLLKKQQNQKEQKEVQPPAGVSPAKDKEETGETGTTEEKVYFFQS